MGSVYSGVHPVIGKKVAIKVLNPSLASDAGAVSRFVSEARSVNHIQHPNIVDIFSFGQLPDNRNYFVMELLEGRTLKEELERQSPIPTALALHVLWHVCDALEAAHARGIFHRDLKPDNVFLVERGTGVFVKLLDFGIAKLTGEAGLGLSQTRTGVPMGTPFYMSPEQCRGVGVDHRTDLYSLGVMMYEIFTGQLPFTGNSYIDVIQGHLGTPPRAPTELAAVSESVAQVILRAMAKDAAGRYQSASDLKRELERLSHEAGTPLAIASVTRPIVGAVMATPARLAASVEAPTPSFAVPGKTVGPPSARRLPVGAILGVGVVAAAGLAAVILMSRSTPPAPVAVAVPAPQVAPVQVPAQPAEPAPPAPAVPSVARLNVEVTPSATLKVGEEVRGTGTKFAVEVTPGSHDITLEAPGYEPFHEAVAMTAGAELSRQVTLEKIVAKSRRPSRRDRARDKDAPGSPGAPARTGDATLDPFK